MESERDWRSRELYKKKGLRQQLEPTGYEAFRVSPRTTLKYGKPVRKIYGATVSPDYSRGQQGRHGAKVEWFGHGYAPANTRSGTRLIANLGDYPVDQEEVRRKLMLRGRR